VTSTWLSVRRAAPQSKLVDGALSVRASTRKRAERLGTCPEADMASEDVHSSEALRLCDACACDIDRRHSRVDSWPEREDRPGGVPRHWFLDPGKRAGHTGNETPNGARRPRPPLRPNQTDADTLLNFPNRGPYWAWDGKAHHRLFGGRGGPPKNSEPRPVPWLPQVSR